RLPGDVETSLDRVERQFGGTGRFGILGTVPEMNVVHVHPLVEQSAGVSGMVRDGSEVGIGRDRLRMDRVLHLPVEANDDIACLLLHLDRSASGTPAGDDSVS